MEIKKTGKVAREINMIKFQFVIGKVIIMRGIPGSGKSMMANLLKNLGAVVHSTDNYHIEKFRLENGIFHNVFDKIKSIFRISSSKYKFNGKKIHFYHEVNYHKFCNSVDEGKKYIVVDNTNFKPSLYKEYVEYAKDNGYEVIAIVFKPSDISVHINRNTHNVPLKTLEYMKTTMESNLNTVGVEKQFIINSEMTLEDIKKIVDVLLEK